MPDTQEAFTHLDRFVADRMRADNTPGLALALTDRERTLRVATYGYADLAARAPVTPETLFEIGSISKSFTCLALLQQREAGRLDLHQPVTRYLPWFAVRSRYDAPITPHHLMSHTAGIIRGNDFTPASRYGAWALRETATGSPPGAHFHYSNVGYTALGYLLEDLLDRSYGDIIRSRILDPLGMAATDPTITHDTRRRLAVGHTRLYDDRPGHPSHPLVPATWLEYAAGDGSIASTPADMAAYARLLLNRGRGPRGPLISEESFALLIERVVPAGDGAWYGYGLSVGEEGGRQTIGHGGGMVGYLSMLLLDPDAGLGALALVNGPGDPTAVARYALDLLRAARAGDPLPDPPPVKDRTAVDNAADYAGPYRAGDRALALVAEGDRLLLQHGGARIALERRGPDSFFVAHPDFALSLLRFGREDGTVVEAFHGPDWYAGERYRGPATFDLPPAWRAYPGLYRSHNPWLPALRVVPRKDRLVLGFPAWGVEQPLVPLAGDEFRVGAEEHLPERARFDTIVGGQALRLDFAGAGYYRALAP